MSPETARRISGSWARLRGREDRLAGLFYERLFTLDDRLRDLFVVTDMEAMREKLVATLDLLVGHLTDPVGMRAALEAAAKRHALYGLGRRDYVLGGEALLWALGRELGDGFDDATRAAWAEAYVLVADLMLRAGRTGVTTSAPPR